MSGKADQRAAARKEEPSNEPAVCGIVMPISATTEEHQEAHWAQVQALLHRAVEKAGMVPRNVWDGEATDRITERILKHLFEAPIVICDITDLNPNVMLELGMRLTSKKPTIVVIQKGQRIPFDIGDFKAEPYPGDLNIFEVETFLEKVSRQLQEKLDAWTDGVYQPFLRGVTIDVLEPETRELPFQELVIKQLDAIAGAVGRVEGLAAVQALPELSLRPLKLAPRRSGLMFNKAPESLRGNRIRIRYDQGTDPGPIVDLLTRHPTIASFIEQTGLWGGSFVADLTNPPPLVVLEEFRNMLPPGATLEVSSDILG